MLNLETLVFDLPEDVLKRKWAGDFEGEIELIDALLERDLPQPLKERLKVERKMAQLLPGQFCIPRPKALEMLREKVPDFKDEELDALELDRAVEYIYVHGEKHYLRSFRNTLLHANPAFAARAGVTDGGDRKRLDAAIAGMKAQGGLAYRIRLCGELRINDEAFVKGAQTRVHMPLPQRCAQQSDIELNVCASAVDAERAPQRTAYFERMSSENKPFRVEYAYRNAVRYVDPLADGWNGGHVYPDALPPTEEDLAEQYPHIAFTPYLKALARELMGDETDPVRIAWRFYDYITTHVRYSYMRSYFLIERHAEFCALNGKGDCGRASLRAGSRGCTWRRRRRAATIGRSSTWSPSDGCFAIPVSAEARIAPVRRSGADSTLEIWIHSAWWPIPGIRPTSTRPRRATAGIPMTIRMARWSRAASGCSRASLIRNIARWS